MKRLATTLLAAAALLFTGNGCSNEKPTSLVNPFLGSATLRGRKLEIL